MRLASPTIVEVAKRAGVSISTVSRCLNHPDKVGKKTLQRVRKVIDDINFSPNALAQSFRRGKTNIILVVVHEIGSGLLSEVVGGIRSVLDGRYAVILTESRPDAAQPASFIEMLVAKQVEGVILLCSVPPFSRKIIELNKARNLPIVIGLEPLSDELRKLPSVHIDNFAAASEATAYLIGLGHRRIAFVSGPRQSYVTLDRERGFVAAMADAGLDGSHVHYADLSVNGGINAANDILTGAPPSAIFCANDDMALGVMCAAARRGLSIPGALSVLGFDDMRYAAIANPPLSTVAQPAREIGIHAARRLLDAIDNPDEPGRQTEILQHRLVIRTSTGRGPG